MEFSFVIICVVSTFWVLRFWFHFLSFPFILRSFFLPFVFPFGCSNPFAHHFCCALSIQKIFASHFYLVSFLRFSRQRSQSLPVLKWNRDVNACIAMYNVPTMVMYDICNNKNCNISWMYTVHCARSAALAL